MIEMYLGFDYEFFHAPYVLKGDQAREHRMSVGNQYRAFLNDYTLVLDAILRNNAKPETLGKEGYKKLHTLCNIEKKPLAQIRKKSDFNGLTIELEDLLNEAGLAQQPSHSLYIRGRTIAHLARLIFPKVYFSAAGHGIFGNEEIVGRAQTKSCYTFGIDFVRYAGTLESDKIKEKKVREVIGSEGLGVLEFWTLAPYVHKELMEQENEPMQSMEKIFNWIKMSDNNKMKLTYFWQCKLFELGEPLGYDERMPTHLRARILGKVVAQEL